MRFLSVIGAGLLLALAGVLGAPGAGAMQNTDLELHALVPLGADAFSLGGKRTFYLMASAENAAFEGWRIIGDGVHRRVLAADGSAVRSFPDTIAFRVTASAMRSGTLEVEQPLPLKINSSLENYLLKLRFRLKIFRGLHSTTLAPHDVKLIGVPADVPYEERIYRVSFNLGNVPISDRIVFEVLSPEGERLTKFHLDLM